MKGLPFYPGIESNIDSGFWTIDIRGEGLKSQRRFRVMIGPFVKVRDLEEIVAPSSLDLHHQFVDVECSEAIA